MTRVLPLCFLAVIVCVGGSRSAAAQSSAALPPAVAQADARQSGLQGLVLDDRGQPLSGAVVSALGSMTAFAVSDAEGRFAFRHLTAGPYLLRAHLQGYLPAPARIIQVSTNGQNSSTIALTRLNQSEQPHVLAAGMGSGGPVTDPATENSGTSDQGEVAWRLRHLKRSVLRDVDAGVLEVQGDDALLGGTVAGLGRAAGRSARMATAFLADLPLTGQINFLTSTSFDRPQDLFTHAGPVPHGVAYISLGTQATGGEWAVSSATTQGDLASWNASGSYLRAAGASHRVEAGLSYGMQRYLGGNSAALAALADGSRSVGAISAYDNWALTPRLGISYGTKYSRYDYLVDRALISPRATVSLRPNPKDSFELRATVSHREAAPGAEEFLPPSTGVWLPPERTFSQLSHRDFVPERTDHLEVAAQRQWGGDVVIGVRAFRQRVDDQFVTLFGLPVSDATPASIGHFDMASAGDFDARGWGANVRGEIIEGVHASVDYTQIDADWTGASPDARALTLVAASVVRGQSERLYGLTASLDGVLPVTSTRVFVLYRLNNRFASEDAADIDAHPGSRFEVQLNQALPFMKFANARWEMLVAVRNMFREDLVDASVYDELLVVRPPKRVVGGVTVKF